MTPRPDPALESWCAALEKRHLASLTFPEVRRALQALSSLYVERRERIAGGRALDGAGKRAAFALFYAPLHYMIVGAIVRALDAPPPPARIVDLGCGTGAAGAAWARSIPGRTRVAGIDASGWAIAEARWNFAALGVDGTLRRGDLLAARLGAPAEGIVAAYTVNELADAARERLRTALLGAAESGSRVLVVEPIAKRSVPWWSGWAGVFREAGGREDLWRFPADLPEPVKRLDRAAGLDHRELTARSLWLAR